jgi:peroxiredoxin family protein
MKLDANDYRLSKQAIADMMQHATYDKRLELIGTASVATGTPIIVVCVYMAELYGMTTELREFLTRLKAFYQVTEILNSEVEL